MADRLPSHTRILAIVLVGLLVIGALVLVGASFLRFLLTGEIVH